MTRRDASPASAPTPRRARRALGLLAALAAPACLAAECTPLRWGSDLVFRGVVETRSGVEAPRAPVRVLRLSEPLCVRGFRLDGTPFRHDGITTVRLGLPAHLDNRLRDGDTVALRGELWWPARNDSSIDMTLAVKDVL